MGNAKKGDVVRVHFSSFLDDGTIYESTLNGEPMQMKLGEAAVVPGFDNAVMGMKAGDTKTILIEAEDAYGLRSEDLVIDEADLNHPLAGQYVIFEIKVVEIASN